MARFIAAHRNPANPEIFGQDPVRLFFEGLGIGAAGLGNDKLIAPIAKQVLPVADGTVSKLVDAVTTGVSAWVVGEVVGIVDRTVGRDMAHGGFILAVARAVTAFVPGYQLSETIPLSIGQIAGGAPAPAGQMNAASAPQLPAGTSASSSSAVNPSYVMNDYPRGISPTQDVGL